MVHVLELVEFVKRLKRVARYLLACDGLYSVKFYNLLWGCHGFL